MVSGHERSRGTGTTHRNVAVAAVLVLLGSPAEEARADRPGPILFDTHEPIEFTLEADFDQIKDDREQESEERPATIRWTGDGGIALERALQVRTRGLSRLRRRTCSMPPLRLNFKTASMEGTVFQGQDKVKLVTFCRNRGDYEQNVIEEYLTYRIYNEVTARSFAVRLANITYVDTSGKDDPVTRYGFIIEAEDALADRLGGIMLEPAVAPPDQVDGSNALGLAVFQYLIGNTDWSAVYLHNVRLLSIPMQGYFTIPYDFDASGLVDAPYAAPHPSLRIADVRQRVYRGYCRSGGDYLTVYARFIDQEAAILDLVDDQPGLDDANKREATRYIENFYDVIENPGDAQRRIEGACRKVG